ncbi:MAG: glutamyl-tRNA reductase [Chthoniobacterales bacterium]|nr:glutamyl-tRNA reductase [Chthoniobacterales bacterium]
MEIFCLGLSHHTAGVALRERFAVADERRAAILADLREQARLREAVLLSTCNRVEVYGLAPDAAQAASTCAELLQRQAGIRAEFYRREHEETARHLFRVVCGMDSMVVGETEVLGQVKDAYAEALQSGLTGSALNRLFQQAFRVAKEVRSVTAITRGSVSVGSVAVELAGKIFGDLASCRSLLLGAGETGERVARSLRSRGVRSLVISNRTFERAAQLASELGGMALHFDHWKTALSDVDIVITSTAAQGRLLSRAELVRVSSERGDRPLFLLDLAVPRDLDPEINSLPGIFLHDLDSLQAMARQGMDLREQEISRGEEMIAGEVRTFFEWLRQRAGQGRVDP